MSGSTPAYGEISFNDLQSVFGGTNPIDFNEYYKNNNKGILVLTCGLGKTLISLWIAKELKSKKIKLDFESETSDLTIQCSFKTA